MQVQRKYQAITFITVIDSYIQRYYADGPLDITSATQWSLSMLREWHDYIEGQITLELDEPPETNVQMGTDILYCYDIHPEVMVQLVNDMINTANSTVLFHLDEFLKRCSHVNVAVEFSHIDLNHYGSAVMYFTVISGDIIRIWQDDANRMQGGLHALI